MFFQFIHKQKHAATNYDPINLRHKSTHPSNFLYVFIESAGTDLSTALPSSHGFIWKLFSVFRILPFFPARENSPQTPFFSLSVVRRMRPFRGHDMAADA